MCSCRCQKGGSTVVHSNVPRSRLEHRTFRTPPRTAKEDRSLGLQDLRGKKGLIKHHSRAASEYITGRCTITKLPASVDVIACATEEHFASLTESRLQSSNICLCKCWLLWQGLAASAIFICEYVDLWCCGAAWKAVRVR